MVNLGTAEARVEALASEYMALRRRNGGASGAGGPAEEGRVDAFMFADDDDNYLVQVRQTIPMSPLHADEGCQHLIVLHPMRCVRAPPSWYSAYVGQCAAVFKVVTEASVGACQKLMDQQPCRM